MIPKCIQNGPNYFFLEIGEVKYCFSYTACVAMIAPGINGMEYTEFTGPNYFSKTSNKHKKSFRDYYGIGEN